MGRASYPPGVRGHHIGFPKKWVRVNNAYESLFREEPMLIPPLEDVSHMALHDTVVVVPLVDHYTICRVRCDFEPIQGDYMGSLEQLMRSYEYASTAPKVSHIQASLCQLAIHAFDMQRPFIKEGLWTPNC